jgi:hypothetical protein
MIYALLKLHGLAQQRGEGLLLELAEGLRKTPRLRDGPVIVTDGGAGNHRDKTDIERVTKDDEPAALKARHQRT